MSFKDQVKETKVLEIKRENKPAVISKEIDAITQKVVSDLNLINTFVEDVKNKVDQVKEIRQRVLENLMYVRKNKKKLLKGQTFTDYLKNDIGIDKGYFYDQLTAYNLCLEYKQPGLFKEIDYKILKNIAREKDQDKQKEYIENVHNLTRDDFKKSRPGLQNENIIDVTPEPLHPMNEGTYTLTEKGYVKEDTPYQADMKQIQSLLDDLVNFATDKDFENVGKYHEKINMIIKKYTDK